MNVPSTKSLESATKQGRSSRAWINHVLNDCAQNCAQTGDRALISANQCFASYW